MTINTKLLLILLIGFHHNSCSQTEIKSGQMVFRYEIIEDSINCFLTAPTSGWIMVGFNSENSPQEADFKFFSIRNKTIIAEDHINTGGRNYLKDELQGGQNNINIIQGSEHSNNTQIQFSIPLLSLDKYDFQHDLESWFYLILAYSENDDFQHHSRYRKNIKHKWITNQ